MGLFSFFKREENYEEILSGLELDIKRAEKQQALAIERMEWWAYNWLFYVGIGWLAYLLGFVLYVWPERHGAQASGFLMHTTLVATTPLVIYYGNVGIRAAWRRVIDRHNTRIKRLREELKERLDELKKKTAFDTTKNLIDKYTAGEQTPAAERGQAARLKQEAKNRRRTMPNFGTPGSQSTNQAGPLQASPLAAKSQRALSAQQQQQQQLLGLQGATAAIPPNNGQLQPLSSGELGRNDAEVGIVKVTPRGSSLQNANSGSVSRPWLDKLVDQLVGDVGSDKDKYALICRHCYAHNGLVLEEEIRDIQYTCPKCGSFNPSIRALRAGTNPEAQMPTQMQQKPTQPPAPQSQQYEQKRQGLVQHDKLPTSNLDNGAVSARDLDGSSSDSSELEEPEKQSYQKHVEDLAYDEDQQSADEQDSHSSTDDDERHATDDAHSPISTPVTRSRTLRNQSSKESLEQSAPKQRPNQVNGVKSPQHSRSSSKSSNAAGQKSRKRRGRAKGKRS
ncbi:hypothetical protein H4R20_000027 [Coemansia guatemalensis]|uniref:Endoplasmic reticulum junction formation protein lunapark n=1 Tax=Coemansia guatemalensis TaxID=2761395 RepID=A0A9W8I610_9FUNG|nr:hypothetical protein H4R20_000027 [Coemansia guatemalensis]